MFEERNGHTSTTSLPDFQPDLAFPRFTEDMVERLRPYGREETFSANYSLYTRGERLIDMFVVLDGEIV